MPLTTFSFFSLASSDNKLHFIRDTNHQPRALYSPTKNKRRNDSIRGIKKVFLSMTTSLSADILSVKVRSIKLVKIHFLLSEDM